jgi:hypothetical protein
MQFGQHLDLDGSESPEGVGRVVAGMAADPHVMLLSGRALRVHELADRYGVDTSG